MNNIINYCKQIGQKKKVWLIVLALAYNIGVVFGIIFFNSSERVLFVNNSIDFMLLALSKDGSAVSLLFTRLWNLIALVVVFGLSGLITYLLFPIHFLLILYRGYVLGVAVVVFILNFGVTGAILFVFAVFVQNLLTTAVVAMLSAFALNEISEQKNCKVFNTKRYIICCVLCATVALIGILFEFLMLVVVLRPLNFYF